MACSWWLFQARGHPATTMEQVADEAGVALKTVYVAFATKSGLLRALWDLRPGLGVERAADILWTLNHPDVWLLLVGERGWTPGQWERWLAATASQQLLRS